MKLKLHSFFSDNKTQSQTIQIIRLYLIN